MDIQIQVKGVDELVKNLRDLGVNRIPNYVARGTDRDRESGAGRDDRGTRNRCRPVRGSWLNEGHQQRINRKAATKNDLTAAGIDDCAMADRARNEDGHHAAQGVVPCNAEDMATWTFRSRSKALTNW